MHTHLFDRVNIRPDYSFIPDGTCEDSEFECRRYENQIRSLGGIDMQLLGLGRNGHIGFNEPSDSFAQVTHCVDLTQSTIDANKRFFASEADVPRQGIHNGYRELSFRQRRSFLLASGEGVRQKQLRTHYLDQLHHMFRHLFFRFIRTLQSLQMRQHCLFASCKQKKGKQYENFKCKESAAMVRFLMERLQ